MGKKTYTNEEIKKVADSIRKQVLKFAIERGGCYLGQACGSADTLATLYLDVMNLGESQGDPDGTKFPGVPGPNNMDYPKGALYNGPTTSGYDRFFLSPAHYAGVLYCTLAACGRMKWSAVEHFNEDGWAFEMIGAEHSPGFETNAGSLGQTISVAGGTAHSRKLKNEAGLIYCYMSDGELEEGQVWEAMQVAAHFKLDNLVVVIDANGQQIEGFTQDIMGIEPLKERFESFGAVAVDIDGHDIQAIKDAAKTPHPDKPLAIICRTSPYCGIPFLKRREPNLHFVGFKTPEEIQEAKAFLETM